MSIKILSYVVGCWLLFMLSLSYGSELTGRLYVSDLSGVPASAQMRVVCGEKYFSSLVKQDGTFSIRSLPAQTPCSYQLWY